MADFSFLSDTDDSVVEEILAEAADHVALKQISALNLSSVSDSVLPQHLESRFRRLKTFPSSLPHPNPQPSADSDPKLTESTHTERGSSSGKSPVDKPGSKAKSRSGSARRRRSGSPSRSPSSSSESSSTSWLETKSSPKSKAEKGFGSVSPPSKKKTDPGWGCLWCSPKKALKKLSFTKRSGGGGGGLDWGGNDAVLEGIGGVGSLSRKEQEKILKRAAKEEMKISEEAEKIVKWAKQVSARMEAFGVEDDDDDDNELHYK